MEEDEERNFERERRSTSSQSNSFNSARSSSQHTLFNSCLEFEEINKEMETTIIENQLNNQDHGSLSKYCEIKHEDLEDCDLNGQDSELVII